MASAGVRRLRRLSAPARPKPPRPPPKRAGSLACVTSAWAKQLAYERRRRQERTRLQKQAAKLLGEGLTQEQAAAVLGVTSLWGA
jgi:hypothetical protein